jgi:hypothetical protein
MNVTQLSVPIENRAPQLMRLTRLLADEGINLRALSLVGSSDFSIVRFVPDYPQAARSVLQAAGIVAVASEVLAVCLDDEPGSFSALLSALVPAEIHVEYSYPLSEQVGGRAVMLLRVSDPAGASRVLAEQGFVLLSQDHLAGRE